MNLLSILFLFCATSVTADGARMTIFNCPGADPLQEKVCKMAPAGCAMGYLIEGGTSAGGVQTNAHALDYAAFSDPLCTVVRLVIPPKTAYFATMNFALGFNSTSHSQSEPSHHGFDFLLKPDEVSETPAVAPKGVDTVIETPKHLLGFWFSVSDTVYLQNPTNVSQAVIFTNKHSNATLSDKPVTAFSMYVYTDKCFDGVFSCTCEAGCHPCNDGCISTDADCHVTDVCRHVPSTPMPMTESIPTWAIVAIIVVAVALIGSIGGFLYSRRNRRGMARI